MQIKYNTLKFVLMVICITAVTTPILAQNENSAQELKISQTPFIDRVHLLSSLNFETGETKTIASPYKNTFLDIVIPTYRGLPRLGLQNSYLAGNRKQTKALRETRNGRAYISEALADNIITYTSLLALDIIASQVTLENLKVYNQDANYSNQKYYTYTKQGTERGESLNYIPRKHVETLASRLLTKETYTAYCCKEEGFHCSPDIKNRQVFWAGNENEFRARASYYKYIENEVPKLKEWSKQLEKEFYLVSSSFISPYDFDKGGFEITFLTPNQTTPIYGGSLYYKAKDEKLKEIFDDSGSNKVFMPVSGEKAEKMILAIEAKSGKKFNNSLFAVFKGRIHGLINAHRDVARFGRLGYMYEIIDPRIEFFTDEELKDKFFETTLYK